MPRLPLVSIIMNCYNSDRFLRQAIDSVYDQTYDNWEIIFWDNVSTDNSAHIAKSYDDRIKYFLAESKTSLGEARNLALEKVRGRYVCFLDCDDLYLPKKLQKQVRMMEDNDYVLSYGSALIINEHGGEIRNFPAKNNSGYIFPELLNHYEINMQSAIVRHSFLVSEKLNFLTSLQYCPDHNLFMHIASIMPIGVEHDYIVKYRVLKNSLSSKTMSIAGSEVRFTLDQIGDKRPELKTKYVRQFEQGYAKSIYYDVVAAIYNFDSKTARDLLKPLILLRYEYFFLYFLLFMPLPNKAVLRLLSRHV